MNAPAALTIHHLRCPLPARQPVVARLALEALAAEVAAAPTTQPPQSLLVVRQLALEVPGLSLARLPDSGQRLAAGRGAGSMLADAWSQAASPASGDVSLQANAVRFGDPAELLACIARDGLAGRLDRWWWRTLLGAAFPDWRQAWARRPEAVPAALRLLDREGLASVVRLALEHPAADIAKPDVLAPPAPTTPAPTVADPVSRTADTAPAPHSLQTVEATAPAFAAPRREPAVPEASLAAKRHPVRPHPATPAPPYPPPPPSPTQPLTSVTAAQPPAIISAASVTPTSGMLDATAAAVKTPETSQSPATTPAKAQVRPASDVTPLTGTHLGEPATGAADIRDEAMESLESAPPPDKPEQAAAALTARAPAAAQPPRLIAEIEHLLAIADKLPAPPSAPAARIRATVDPASPTASGETIGRSLEAPPIPVRSRHARLFFLVNLLLGDGLYPDFTQPATAGFPVPIWRLLALLGSGLAGPALCDDPLWPLLDRLADELPTGEDCAFARDWPIPAALTQGPRTARTAAPAIRPRTLRHARPQGFARWLTAYRHALRQRLAAALDLPPALLGRAFVQEDSAALIWVSAAEVVVVQPLDEHPVTWRLAGLDRDPGFLPSAGRSLRFIFE